MLLDCQISKVLPQQSGTTKEGKPFLRQPIEITWQESRRNSAGETFVFENSTIVDLKGQYAQNFALKEGDYVTIDLRFYTNPWKDKILTSITSNYIILRSS